MGDVAKPFGPSLGEPGYLPYCGGCSTMRRMTRGKDAFECHMCGLRSRNINGEDMFDRTAPEAQQDPSNAQ